MAGLAGWAVVVVEQLEAGGLDQVAPGGKS